jgi:hypothetical protein
MGILDELLWWTTAARFHGLRESIVETPSEGYSTTRCQMRSGTRGAGGPVRAGGPEALARLSPEERAASSGCCRSERKRVARRCLGR